MTDTPATPKRQRKPSTRYLKDNGEAPPTKKQKTESPRKHKGTIDWSQKSNVAALKEGIGLYGRAFASIKKDYFPAAKPKEIQNFVNGNLELSKLADEGVYTQHFSAAAE